MLIAFIDDSGTDRKPPFCVLAGYISDESRWQRFSEEWQTEIDSEPCIKYLKMREPESLRGEFRGWDVDVRQEKLLRLARIIKRNVIGGVGSFVSNRAYDAIAKGCLPETVDHPYWLCFQRIIVEAGILYRHGSNGQHIDFTFDGQGAGFERRGHFMHKLWAELLQGHPALCLGKLDFRNDREALPLQASDMLAWHMRRHADNAVLKRAEERPVAEVLWSIPTPARAWEPQEIDEFVEVYQKLHPDSPLNQT